MLKSRSSSFAHYIFFFFELNVFLTDHKPPSYEDIDDNTDAFVQWCVNLKKDMALSSESDLGRNIISCLEYLEVRGSVDACVYQANMGCFFWVLQTNL